MSFFTLLVIADPEAPFLREFLSRSPENVSILISNNTEELKAHASKADAILYAYLDARLLANVLPLANRVRWVHCLWTGVEGILVPELLAHPALLTNARGAFKGPLADWVIAVMLFFAFDLRRVIRQQEQAIWDPFVGDTLNGRTLGVVGYGAIGSAAASRARTFGTNIAALRRRSELFAGDITVDRSYSPSQLKEMMAASDYVLVTTPLTAATRGLIGEAEIEAMKSTAVIINIGRGPVIDEASLIRALESGRIQGAALDVFNTEPLPANHPFWRMPNVLLSPHTADRVSGFLEPAFECFLENLNRFIAGQPLLNVVDKAAGY
jgi:phosphoglycerate dehydrogenase-like enzyme